MPNCAAKPRSSSNSATWRQHRQAAQQKKDTTRCPFLLARQSIKTRRLMRFSGCQKSDSHFLWLGMWACVFLISSQISWAAGPAPAGTIISNVATVNYSLAGVIQPPPQRGCIGCQPALRISPAISFCSRTAQRCRLCAHLHDIAP